MAQYEPYVVLHKTNKTYERFILDESTVTFKFSTIDKIKSDQGKLEYIVERVLQYFKRKFNPAPWESVAIVVKPSHQPKSAFVGLIRSDQLTAKLVIDKMISSIGLLPDILISILENPVDITFAHVRTIHSSEE